MKQNIIIVVALAAILALVYYLGSTTGYRAGELAAAEQYTKQVAEYRTALDNQTAVVNKALSLRSVDLTKEINALIQDTQQIRAALKESGPLVVVREGDCVASEQLLEARRKIIERANK